jgi:hypothetical protein
VTGRSTRLAGRGAAALLGTLVLAPAAARADHDMAMADHHHGGSAFSVGLSVQAAEFDNQLYVGSYQGIAPSISWSGGGIGASATIGLYHVTENGLSLYGPGDASFGAHAALLTTEATESGLALHVMAPTGSDVHGFGMGHVMVMPSAWTTWRVQRFAVTARAGYGRALSELGAPGGHVHGQMPLVDPMNMQELTWSAGGDVELGHGLRAGGRALGGIPIGMGTTRVIGAGRVAWGTPRVTTGLELQLGLAGDPFTIRGVVETTLRF